MGYVITILAATNDHIMVPAAFFALCVMTKYVNQPA